MENEKTAIESIKIDAVEVKNIALGVIRTEVQSLTACEAAVNDAFVQAVEAVAKCRGRVVVAGIGKSGIIGRKIAATLASTGTPAIFVHATEALHGDLGMVTEHDLILALSYSGHSDELNKILPILRQRGITIIGMSSNAQSDLAKKSGIHITLPQLHEACPYNLAPTSSTTAMLGVGDALAICLMKIKKFEQEHFALFHPGGMLGKLLTCNVVDIMQSGERNPVVAIDATVKDALLVMTKTKSGAAAVVNSDGTLAGFFTDGDLRRNLQEDSALLQKSIAQVMTTQPVVLTDSMKAVEAAKIISQRRIDNAPVVNAAGKVVGIVDEGDLLPFITT
ncbi:MAG: KpsF/GutQ family sugar-phosphate isomerase [Prevotellaceae bacterium]|jgi:arabinose-5-phosphate isomerase|nr:KpsF/GutQ family sugar-phosphate isomerase [Prevotellaceae bacterium]